MPRPSRACAVPAAAVPAALMAALLAAAGQPAAAAELTVMSFNIWGGGANEDKPVDETVAAIRAAGADIVGVQETRTEGADCTAEHCPPGGESVAAALAARLGFHLHEQTAENDALWANAVLSRWPIVAASPQGLGVRVDADGTPVLLFNIHLDDAPYQPYQLHGIEYGPYPFLDTAAEAEAAARDTRFPAIDRLEADLEQMLAGTDGRGVVVITGDFNEPSHLDWTAATVAAGHHRLAVAWPVSRRLEDWGFVDALRAVHPDPVAKPARTWTPTSEPDDPEDHHDRIDFVHVRGAEVIDAAIVGERTPEADIVVVPWPSDHRAVVARIRY